MNTSDLPTDNDLLPEGMTPELAERIKALIVEIRNLGMTVLVSAADSNGRVFALGKGNSLLIGAMVLRAASAAGVQVTCPACQARQSGGSARA